MAGSHHNGNDNNEKIVYVGDSRVPKPTKVHIPPDYSAFPGKSEAFIPNFLLKEWMVGCVFLVGVLVLTVSHPAPLGYPADPTNTGFIPMPDWYFLFMYQLLKYPYMSNQFIVLGTVGLPGLAFGALMLVPFLDRSPERRFYRRPVTSAMMLLSLAAIVYLTNVSWTHYQHELEVNGITPEHIEREEKMLEEKKARESGEAPPPAATSVVFADDPAADVYERATCVQCHGTDMRGGGGLPSLIGIGDKYSEEELAKIVHDGIGGMAPQYDANLEKGLTEEEMDSLIAWLALQKAENEGKEAPAH
ncbi:menaquinol-cytochrome c reductase cytochrome b/c subunit [Paenibacillus sp.]|uniref:menaquinol-cytochrome c reductase cytochrome b/c subunit n=1 Tax=Paenibacillus sp. TaxID=58172 RepID=UPI002D762BE1|nr:c-type cytochrome [Paenibacillus sp.]HZG55105.1 c-type cytochrome [Paenibacillus sp.]